MLLILGRWRQSNAQDATVKNLLKSSGLIDQGNLGAIALNAERKERNTRKPRSWIRNLKLMRFLIMCGSC